MKWFFAYNGLRPGKFDTHVRAMVRSAMINTSLDPHLIYFGDPSNPVLSFVQSRGVKVIHREPSILRDLERIKAKFPEYNLGGASGTFLRVDLPLICHELGYSDEYVLYTDCDVVFLRDIPPASTQSFLEPTLFSCAPEHSPTDWVEINAGVMVMNVISLLEDYPSFKSFITSGDTLYHELFKKGAYDQQAYRLHYASKWDRLALEYNWKPYWGFNEDAVIVHFHGPKIPQVRELMKGNTARIPKPMIDLFERDPDSYRKYLDYVDQYESD